VGTPSDPSASHAQPLLVGHESAPGFALDAASQPGDDGFAVLGKNQRLAFLELADLFGARRMALSSPERVCGRHCPGLPAPACDPNLPDQIGDRRLNAPSLEPPNNTKTLVNPNSARAWCSPKIAACCRYV
jgi:hypothetical protein